MPTKGLEPYKHRHLGEIHDLTPALIGSSNLQYAGYGCIVNVSYPVVRYPNYTVEIEYSGDISFQWKGAFDQSGARAKRRFRTVVDGRYDRTPVLTLAMMWIFKKRAFSLSRDFEELVIKEEEVDERRYMGQVDLEGKPVFRWVLVGFWAGDLGVWSKVLSYSEFFKIYSSEDFVSKFRMKKWMN